MNKKLIWLIPILLILGVAAYLLFFNHSKDSKHSQFIQKSSKTIIKINSKSLYDKFNEENGLDEKTIETLFKDFEGAGGSSVGKYILKKLRKDPLSCGLDLRSDVFFFMPNFEDVNCYALAVSIKDIDAFNRMMLKMKDIESNLRKTEDFYIIKEDEDLCYTWNENGLLILKRKPIFNFYNTTGVTENIEVYANELMTLEVENSFAKSENFKVWVKNTHDLSIFGNAITSNIDNETAKLLKVFGLINDEFATASHIDFQKDKILMTSDFYGNKSVLENFEILNKSGVSDASISRVCHKNPIILMGANLNLKKISKIINEGFKDYERELMDIQNKTGMDIKKLDQYFTGEITFALDQLKSKNIEAEFPAEFRDLPMAKMYRDISEPVFNLSIGVKNKTMVKEVLDRSELTALGDDRYIVDESLFLVLMDDFLYVTSDIENANQIKKDGFLVKEVEFKSDAKKNPLFGFVNLNLNSIENLDKFPAFKMMNTRENIKIKNLFDNFKYLEFKTNNKLNGDAELLFTPSESNSDNSLQRLTKLIASYNG
jgi:hypothetical protein